MKMGENAKACVSITHGLPAAVLRPMGTLRPRQAGPRENPCAGEGHGGAPRALQTYFPPDALGPDSPWPENVSRAQFAHLESKGPRTPRAQAWCGGAKAGASRSSR